MVSSSSSSSSSRPGRQSEERVTVFGAVGLAFQDLVAGWLAYALARKRSVGQGLHFLV